MAGTLLGHAVLAGLYVAVSGMAWRMSWQGSVVLGGAIAMSSTAIVVKMMSERLELESEHGKRVIGVLLFQDLAVVPLLVLIPALNSSERVFRVLSLNRASRYWIASDCQLAGHHIAQGMQIAGKPTEGKLAHPITLLRIAYGLKE